MGEHILNKVSFGSLLMALALAAVGVGLLVEAETVAGGIRDGLAVCGNVLIPSLFPFMALSSFVSTTKYAEILSLPLKPITTKVYKLPQELGVIVLLSLIGGFPVGAKMIANLLEEGKINAATAERMLCFCVNSGPSFLISAVGIGMFFNQRIGIVLFATQTAATLLVGAWVSRKVQRIPSVGTKQRDPKGGAAFVSAVTGASSAMLTMCAFAILFSGVLALVRGSGLIAGTASILPVGEATVNAAVSGFLEVTAGCIQSSSLEGTAAIAFVSCCVSFCGLSVLFQIMSCFHSGEIRFRKLIGSRMAHGAVSTTMAVPLYQVFCADVQVWSGGTAPVMYADYRTGIISICLLSMCSVLILSTRQS